LYLPCAWLREEGIDPDRWLANPVFDAAVGRVVQRLLEAADALYARAALGIAWLPPLCRPGMHAARVLYAEIGREVERQGLDSIAQRAHVRWQRKLRLLPQVLVAAVARKRELPADALAEVRFLIDAAAEARSSQGTKDGGANRLLWLLELFDRLERGSHAGTD
jgi:15-cis-phytoene synthase